MNFADDLPLQLVRLAARLLPSPLREWGEAAVQEVGGIEPRLEAWLFAIGCLAWAVREAAGSLFSRLASFAAARVTKREDPMPSLTEILERPRTLAMLCAVAATTAGLIYMGLAGAPALYLMINLGALAFGFVTLATLGLAAARQHFRPGVIGVTLGLILLAVSLWGTGADGVTRWVTLGGLAIQPSFIIVPLTAVLFTRSRDALSLLGVVLVASALALQPDRGMAGALAAGMLALAFFQPGRNSGLAAAAAVVGFAVTVARADPSPAVPYVDQILHTAFAAHPLAGVAVLAGSALLAAPALIARRGGRDDEAAYLVFGAVWTALVVAAALGNYPTPLVGYGGSAIVGYLVSLMAFPTRAAVPSAELMPLGQKDEGEDPSPLAFAS